MNAMRVCARTFFVSVVWIFFFSNMHDFAYSSFLAAACLSLSLFSTQTLESLVFSSSSKTKMVRVKRNEQHIHVMKYLPGLCLCFFAGIVFFPFLVFPKEESLKVQALSFTARKPHLIYGTAWKKDETADLVKKAVLTGFRFIDTACQPKHYNEAGVGHGWKAAAKELGLQRSDLWLQTKFTSIHGQDPNNLPYDPNAPLEEQIKTSLETSLKNLQTSYLDSWVMHSPMETMALTIKAWKVMEEAVQEGKVRQLGISNCYSLNDFQTLYKAANFKPKVLQNRFYDRSNFDTELRQFCKENGIQYQSFWTLTANRHALATEEAKEMAKQHGLTPQTYMYAFLMSLGYVSPLSGTTSPSHMVEDVNLMKRFQKGDVFFNDEEELRKFARLLKLPDL